MPAWRRELLWAVPCFAVVMSAGTIVIKKLDHDASSFLATTYAPIYTLVLAIVAAAVARAVRGEALERLLDQVTNVYPRAEWVVYGSSVVLVLAPIIALPKPLSFCPKEGCAPEPVITTPSTPSPPSTSVPSPQVTDDTTAQYFGGGTVYVGINGCLRGWTLVAGTTGDTCATMSVKRRSVPPGQVSGFDAQLATYLADRYGFKDRLQFVPLTQFERLEPAVWTTGVNGKPAVQLIVSTMSITEDRMRTMDFAGPYYYDVTAVWRNLDKPDASSDADTMQVCAVNGTSSQRILSTPGQTQIRVPFSGVGKIKMDQEATHLGTCLEKFDDLSEPVTYVGSDWSILRAYTDRDVVSYLNPDVVVKDADMQPGALSLPADNPPPAVDTEGIEQYGVALAKDHPQVRLSLCRALDDFLTSYGVAAKTNWTSTFAHALAPHSLVTSWHRPASTQHADTRLCAGA